MSTIWATSRTDNALNEIHFNSGSVTKTHNASILHVGDWSLHSVTIQQLISAEFDYLNEC